MDWDSAGEWVQDLPAVALETFQSLDRQIQQFQVEKLEKTAQMDCLEQVIEKQKLKLEEERSENVMLTRTVQKLEEQCKECEDKHLKLQDEIHLKDSKIKSLEEQIEQMKSSLIMVNQFERDIAFHKSQLESAQRQNEELEAALKDQKKCNLDLQLQFTAFKLQQGLIQSDVEEMLSHSENSDSEVLELQEKIREQEYTINELKRQLNENSVESGTVTPRRSVTPMPSSDSPSFDPFWGRFETTGLEDPRRSISKRDSLLVTPQKASNVKVLFLEQRLKEVSREYECLRMNSESAKLQMEQEHKEKEDELKAEIKKQAQLIVDLDSELQVIKDKLEQDMMKTSEELDVVKNHLNEADNLKLQLEENVKHLNQQICDMKNTLQAKDAVIAELTKTEESVEARLNSVRSQNKELNSANKLNPEVPAEPEEEWHEVREDFEMQQVSLKDKVLLLEQEVSETNDAMKRKNEELDMAREERSSLKRKYEEKSVENKYLKSSNTELSIQLKERKEKLDQLQEKVWDLDLALDIKNNEIELSDEEIVTLQTTLSKQIQKLNELEQKLKETEIEKQSIQEQCSNLEQTIEDLDGKNNELVTLQNEISLIKVEYEAKISQLGETEHMLKQMEIERKSLQEQYDNLEQSNMQAVESIKAKDVELAELRDEISTLQIDYEAKALYLHETQSKLNNLEDELASYQEDYMRLQANLTETSTLHTNSNVSMLENENSTLMAANETLVLKLNDTEQRLCQMEEEKNTLQDQFNVLKQGKKETAEFTCMKDNELVTLQNEIASLRVECDVKTSVVVEMELKTQCLEKENEFLMTECKNLKQLLAEANQLLFARNENILHLENNISHIEDVNKTVMSKLTEMRQKLQQIEEEKQFLLERSNALEQNSAQAVEALRITDNELVTLQGDISALKEEYENKISLLVEMELKQQCLEEDDKLLTEKLRNLEQTLAEVRDVLVEKDKKLLSSVDDISVLKADNEILTTKLNEMKQELHEMENEKRVLKEQSSILESNNEETKGMLHTKDEQILALQNEISTLRTEFEMKTSLLVEMELKQQCSEEENKLLTERHENFEQTLSEVSDTLVEKDKKLLSSVDAISVLKADNEILTTKLKEMKQELHEMENEKRVLKEQSSILESNNEETKGMLHTKDEQILALQNEISTLRTEFEMKTSLLVEMELKQQCSEEENKLLTERHENFEQTLSEVSDTLVKKDKKLLSSVDAISVLKADNEILTTLSAKEELKVRGLEEEKEQLIKKCKNFERVVRQISEIIFRKDKKVVSLLKEVTKFTDENETLMSKLNEMKQELHEMENEKRVLQEQSSILESNNEETKGLLHMKDEQILTLQNEISTLKSESEMKTSILDEMKHELHQMDNEKEVLQEQFSILESNKEETKGMLHMKVEQILTLQNEISTLKTDSEMKTSLLIEMELKVQCLQEESELLIEKCRYFEGALSKMNDFLVAKDKNLSSLGNELSTLKEEKEILTSEANELKEQKQALENELLVLKEEVQKVNAENVERINASSATEKEFLNLKKSFEEKIEELTQREFENEKLVQEISTLQKDLAEMNMDIEVELLEKCTAEAQLTELKEDNKLLKEKITDLERNINDKDIELNSLQSGITSLTAAVEYYTNLTRNLSIIVDQAGDFTIDLQEVIAEKDNLLQENENTLKEQDHILKSKEENILSMEKEIMKWKSTVSSLEMELAKSHSSFELCERDIENLANETRCTAEKLEQQEELNKKLENRLFEEEMKVGQLVCGIENIKQSVSQCIGYFEYDALEVPPLGENLTENVLSMLKTLCTLVAQTLVYKDTTECTISEKENHCQKLLSIIQRYDKALEEKNTHEKVLENELKFQKLSSGKLIQVLKARETCCKDQENIISKLKTDMEISVLEIKSVSRKLFQLKKRLKKNSMHSKKTLDKVSKQKRNICRLKKREWKLTRTLNKQRDINSKLVSEFEELTCEFEQLQKDRNSIEETMKYREENLVKEIEKLMHKLNDKEQECVDMKKIIDEVKENLEKSNIKNKELCEEVLHVNEELQALQKTFNENMETYYTPEQYNLLEAKTETFLKDTEDLKKENLKILNQIELIETNLSEILHNFPSYEFEFSSLMETPSLFEKLFQTVVCKDDQINTLKESNDEIKEKLNLQANILEENIATCGNLQKDLNEAKSQLQSSHEKVEEMKSINETLNSTVAEVKETLAATLQQEQQIKHNLNTILANYISKLNVSFEKLDDLPPLIHTLYEEMVQQQNKVTENMSIIDSKSKEISDFENLVKELTEKFDNESKLLLEKNQENETLSSRLTELENQLKICHEQLNEKHTDIENYVEKCKDLEKSIKDLLSEVTSLQNANSTLNLNIDGLEEHYQNVLSEKEQFKYQLANILTDFISSNEIENTKLENLLAVIQKIRTEHEKLTEENSEAGKTITEQSSKIVELERIVNELSDESVLLLEKIKENEVLQIKLTGSEEQVQKYQACLEDKETEITELKLKYDTSIENASTLQEKVGILQADNAILNANNGEMQENHQKVLQEQEQLKNELIDMFKAHIPVAEECPSFDLPNIAKNLCSYLLNLKNDLNEALSNIEGQNKEITKLTNNIKELEENMATESSLLANKIKENESLQEDIRKVEIQIQEHLENLEAKSEEISNWEVKQEESIKLISTLKEEITTQRNENAELNSTIAKLEMCCDDNVFEKQQFKNEFDTILADYASRHELSFSFEEIPQIVQNLYEELTKMNEEKENILQLKIKEISELREEINDVSTKLREVNLQKEEKVQECEILNTKISEIELKLQSSMDSLKVKQTEILNITLKYDDVNKLALDLQEQIASLHSENSTLKSNITKLEESYHMVNEGKQQLKTKLCEILDDYVINNDLSFSSLEHVIPIVETLYEKYKEQGVKIEELENIVNVKLNEISEFQQIIDDLNEKVNKETSLLSEKTQECEVLSKKLDETVRDLQNSIKTLENKEAAIIDLTSKCDDFDKQVMDLKEQEMSLQSINSTLNSKIKEEEENNSQLCREQEHFKEKLAETMRDHFSNDEISCASLPDLLIFVQKICHKSMEQKTEIDEAKATISIQKNQIIELEQSIIQLSEDVNSESNLLSNKIHENEVLEMKLKNLEEQINSLQADNLNLNTEVKDLKTDRDMTLQERSQLKEILSSVINFTSDLELDNMPNFVQRLCDNLQESTAKNCEYELIIDDQEKMIIEYENSIGKLTDKINEKSLALDEKIQELEMLNSDLIEAYSELMNAKTLIKGKGDELLDWESRYEALSKNILEVKQQLSSLESANEILSISNKNNEEKYQKLNEEKNSLKEEILKIFANDTAEDIADVEDLIILINKELKQKQSNIDGANTIISTQNNEIKELKESVVELNEKLNNNTNLMVQKQKECQELQRKVFELEEQTEKCNKNYEEKIDELLQVKTKLETCEKCLDDTCVSLSNLQSEKTSLNSAMEEMKINLQNVLSSEQKLRENITNILIPHMSVKEEDIMLNILATLEKLCENFNQQKIEISEDKISIDSKIKVIENQNAELTNWERKYETLAENASYLEKQLSSVELTNESLSSSIKEYEEKCQKLNQEKQHLHEEIMKVVEKDTTENIAEVNIEDIPILINTMKEELKQKQSNISEVNAVVVSQDDEIKELKNCVNDLTEKLSNNADVLVQKQNDCQKLQAKITEMEEQIKDFVNNLRGKDAELLEWETKCATCTKSLDETHLLLSHLESEKATLISALDETKITLQETLSEKKQLKDNIINILIPHVSDETKDITTNIPAALEKLCEEFALQQIKINDNELIINSKTEELSKLEQEVKELTEKIVVGENLLNDQKQITGELQVKLFESSEQLQNYCNDINNKENEISEWKSKYEVCNQNLDNVQQQLILYEGKVVELQGSVKDFIEKLSNEEENVKIRNQEIDNLKGELSNWKFKCESLDGSMSDLWKQVSDLEKENSGLISTIGEVKENLQNMVNEKQQLTKNLESIMTELVLNFEINCKSFEEIPLNLQKLSDESKQLKCELNECKQSIELKNEERLILENSIKSLTDEINVQKDFAKVKIEENEQLKVKCENFEYQTKQYQIDLKDKENAIMNWECKLNEEVKSSDELRKQLASLESANVMLNSTIDEVEENLQKEFLQKQQLTEELNKIMENQNVKCDSFETIPASIQKLCQEIVCRESKLEENHVTIESISKEMDIKNNKILSFEKIIHDLNDQITADGNKLIEQIRQNDLLNVKLGSYEKQLGIYSNDLREKEEIILSLKLKCRDSEETVKELSEKLDSVTSKNITMTSTVDELEKNIQTLHKEKQDCQNKLNKLMVEHSTISEYEKTLLKPELEKNNKLVGILQERIQQLDYCFTDRENQMEKLFKGILRYQEIIGKLKMNDQSKASLISKQQLIIKETLKAGENHKQLCEKLRLSNNEIIKENKNLQNTIWVLEKEKSDLIRRNEHLAMTASDVPQLTSLVSTLQKDVLNWKTKFDDLVASTESNNETFRKNTTVSNVESENKMQEYLEQISVLKKELATIEKKNISLESQISVLRNNSDKTKEKEIKLLDKIKNLEVQISSNLQKLNDSDLALHKKSCELENLNSHLKELQNAKEQSQSQQNQFQEQYKKLSEELTKSKLELQSHGKNVEILKLENSNLTSENESLRSIISDLKAYKDIINYNSVSNQNVESSAQSLREKIYLFIVQSFHSTTEIIGNTKALLLGFNEIVTRISNLVLLTEQKVHNSSSELSGNNEESEQQLTSELKSLHAVIEKLSNLVLTNSGEINEEIRIPTNEEEFQKEIEETNRSLFASFKDYQHSLSSLFKCLQTYTRVFDGHKQDVQKLQEEVKKQVSDKKQLEGKFSLITTNSYRLEKCNMELQKQIAELKKKTPKEEGATTSSENIPNLQELEETIKDLTEENQELTSKLQTLEDENFNALQGQVEALEKFEKARKENDFLKCHLKRMQSKMKEETEKKGTGTEVGETSLLPK